MKVRLMQRSEITLMADMGIRAPAAHLFVPVGYRQLITASKMVGMM